MSTEPLTREQACDKFIKQKMRDGAGGLNRIISRAAFDAGWSARDAEVERLRAAIEAALPAMRNAIRAGLQDFGEAETEAIVNEHVTIKQLQAALVGEVTK